MTRPLMCQKDMNGPICIFGEMGIFLRGAVGAGGYEVRKQAYRGGVALVAIVFPRPTVF